MKALDFGEGAFCHQVMLWNDYRGLFLKLSPAKTLSTAEQKSLS